MTEPFPCNRHPSTPLRMTIFAALANLLLRLFRRVLPPRLVGEV